MKAKRIAATIISIVLIAGMVPMSAFADDFSDSLTPDIETIELAEQETETTEITEQGTDEIDENIGQIMLFAVGEELEEPVGGVDNSKPATIYISANGNDETGNGTHENPYATIAKAASVVNSSGEKGKEFVIRVMTDLTATAAGRFYNNNITITNCGLDDDCVKNPVVTRGTPFTTISDTRRSWYNPAMLEIQTTDTDSSLTLSYITFDDNGLHEGNQYVQAPNSKYSSTEIVQSAIIESTAINLTQIILGEGAVLRNYGGMSAVRVTEKAELIMKSGSEIRGGKDAKKQAIWAQCANVTIENGAKIYGLTGGNVITTAGGENDHCVITIGGEIFNNGTSSAGISHVVQTQSYTDVTVTSTGNVHNNYVGYGTIYLNGTKDTIEHYGKINYNVASDRGGGIVLSNNATLLSGAMYEGAEIIGNETRKEGAGGVLVMCGTFVMNGGTISENKAVYNSAGIGGGVHVRRGGTFIMNGGTVSENEAKAAGGGVAYEATYYGNETKATRPCVVLNGGTISGNIRNGVSNDLAVIKTTATKFETNNQGYGYSGSYLTNIGATVADENVLFTNGNFTVSAPASARLGNASNNVITEMKSVSDSLGWGSPLATFWRSSRNGSYNIKGISSINSDLPVYIVVSTTDAKGNPIGEDSIVRASVNDGVISFTLRGCDENGTGVAVVQPKADYGTVTLTTPEKLVYVEGKQTYEIEYKAEFNISENLVGIINNEENPVICVDIELDSRLTADENVTVSNDALEITSINLHDGIVTIEGKPKDGVSLTAPATTTITGKGLLDSEKFTPDDKLICKADAVVIIRGATRNDPDKTYAVFSEDAETLMVVEPVSPTPNPDPTPTPTPTPTPIPAIVTPVTPAPEPSPEPEPTFPAEENPEEQSEEETEIEETDVPLGPRKSWALVNLLLTAGSILTAGYIGSKYAKRAKTATEGNVNRNHLLMAAAAGIANTVMFALTEQLSGNMVMTDGYTLYNAVISIVSAVSVFASKTDKEKDN